MNDRERRERGGGSGHPLPHSAEAGTDKVPEHLLREKGLGDDAEEPVQPHGDPVAPDGEAYALDQAKHQDRGQGWIETEGEQP